MKKKIWLLRIKLLCPNKVQMMLLTYILPDNLTVQFSWKVSRQFIGLRVSSQIFILVLWNNCLCQKWISIKSLLFLLFDWNFPYFCVVGSFEKIIFQKKGLKIPSNFFSVWGVWPTRIFVISKWLLVLFLTLSMEKIFF